ncbi:diguanylate cyclase [Azorhizobium caulinodans]|uniref:GGDEF domain-containing protein n=1 Tax=Azorhizobium caulinodans TaxID=7 RepID=UPI002FBE6B1B
MIASPPDLIAKLALYSIDAIADMIVWADREGRYVCVNKAAQRLLGYTEEEFQGRRVCDVDPLFDEARWREHWAELERLGSVTLETVNTTKDGVDVPVEVTANLVSVDGRLFNCSIVRDITERRRNEAERRALNERIYQLSITDGLTGISNRRRFDEALASLVAQHARSGKPLSVILIDIDHFKAFNDHYGHLSGDDCLRQVAAVIASLMRGESDLAARFGGEEFACVLPGLDLAGAASVAERLRSGIAGLGIPHAKVDGGHVTASIGAVCCERPMAQTSHGLLATADALLYRAKGEGRNRVAVARL